MDSNTHHHNFQTQNHPPNSGLLRFRSAPSSLLVGCADAAIAGSGGTEAAVEFSNSPRGCLGLPPQYPRQNSAATSFGLVGSVAANQQTPVNSVSNLTRQNSSPAGLFSQLSIQNAAGFVDMGELRSGKGDNGETNLSPSTERLKSQLSLSSLGILSPISEITSEINVEELSNNPFDQSNGSWDDPMKTEEEDSLCSPQKEGEFGNSISLLSRHLSLPKSWVEMEKLLQYQDFVPYKTRAKRGCATHPRSIAERVRRTRISERMRKLQELVPNMDKQTNTADMLDLAVEYIKGLQGQYKTLSNYKAKCKCLSSLN